MGTIERLQLQEQLEEKLRAELATVALPDDDKLAILERLADEVAAEASTDTLPAQSLPDQRVEGSGSWVGEMRVQEPLRIDFSIATDAASDKSLAPAGVVKGA